MQLEEPIETQETEIIFDDSLLFHAPKNLPSFVELEVQVHTLIQKVIDYRGLAVDATTKAEEAGHAVDDAISEILLYLDSQNIPFQ